LKDDITPGITNAMGYDTEASIDVAEIDCRVNSKRKARMGSSTIDRKNRKKRAVITFDDDNA